ncbi:MAG: RHS repeat domain-containing protein, partial [Chlamydiota bacterium]|nr:RHS repeat domain-containing protein [Chlamydiota bacterium]
MRFLFLLMGLWPLGMWGSSDADRMLHQVDTLDGHYKEVVSDLCIAGPDPLILSRSYHSGDREEGEWGGWHLLPHASFSISKKRGVTTIRCGRPEAGDLTFVFPLDGERIARCSLAEWPSPFPQVATLHYLPDAQRCELLLPDGHLRIFSGEGHPWRLIEERLPSSNSILYTYDGEERLIEMQMVTASGELISSITITYGEERVARGSDGSHITYHMDKERNTPLLTKVTQEGLPPTHYGYLHTAGRFRLHKISLPLLPQIAIDYEKWGQGRVSQWKQGETLLFRYLAGETRVTASDGLSLHYRRDNEGHLLAREERLHGQLYRSLIKEWSSEGKLSHRHWQDDKENLLIGESFDYDKEGHLVALGQYGSLTGRCPEGGPPLIECLNTFFQYTKEGDRETLIQYNRMGCGISRTYLPGRSRIAHEEQIIYERKHPHRTYTYNAEGSLLSLLEGDPLSSHTLHQVLPKTSSPQRGSPETITTYLCDPSSQKKETISEIHHRFDEQGRIIATSEGGNSSLTTCYDFAGRIIKQENNQGETLSLIYDRQGALATRSLRGEITHYRHIEGGIDILTSGGNLREALRWDPRQQLISSTDHRGITTHYQRDPLGRIVTILLTPGDGSPDSRWEMTYDPLDH